MSIEAIQAIEKFVHQREHGLPLSEIKRRCEEFVQERDKNEDINAKYRYGYMVKDYRQEREFYRREGKILERVKL